jgi:tetratricopeptide (TPR) repeat protein
MEEEKFGYPEEEAAGIVKRFEDMQKKKASYFFDVSEFETIIDYYLENNDVSFAFDAAETASRQHPGSVSLQLRKAKVLIDRGRAMESLRIVKFLENIEPDNYEVFIIKGASLGMMGDIQGTRRNFDLALALDPDDEPTILASITSILQNLNHYDLLLPYLIRLSEIEPEVSFHLYDIAFAYEKTLNYDRSIEYYNLFLDSDPFFDPAWYNLGVIYNKLDRNDKALECYEYALALNPENFFALFNKGNLYSYKGDYSRALDAYLEYLELEEESSEAMAYAAECYDKLGDKDMARKYYNMAIEQDTGYPEPWFGLGMVELSMNNNSEALHYFTRAVSLEATNPEYWYFMGKSEFREGDLLNAARAYIEALRCDPFYDEAWRDLGDIIIAGKYYKKIIPLLHRTLRMVGDVHGLQFILAASYLYSGNRSMAEKHLSAALDSAPEEWEFFSELIPESMRTGSILKLIENKAI